MTSVILDQLMEAYIYIPYQICPCDLMTEISGWAQFNLSNKAILKKDIHALNHALSLLQQNEFAIQELLPGNLSINFSDFSYGYRDGSSRSDPPITYLEYCPITKANHPCSKPLKVHFSTIRRDLADYAGHCVGKLTYGIDGSIVEASAILYDHKQSYSVSWGIIGSTFDVLKVILHDINGDAPIYNYLWKYTLFDV